MDSLDTRLPMRAAMEARDRSAVLAAFAENAVLRSPFTDAATFEGREQLLPLIDVILNVLGDLTYTDELRSDHRAVLVGRATVDGIPLTFSDHVVLDDDGLIQEMTVFFRPLPATTTAMRRFAGQLGAQHSRARGRLLSAMVAPLAAMTRTGDRIGVRLLKP
jgi:hypothetical protein